MIAIISDTHDHYPLLERVADIIRKRKDIDLVVHCGDLIAPSILEILKGFPLKFVYGNNDGEIIGLTYKAKMLGFETPPAPFHDFTHEDKRFLVIHDIMGEVAQKLLNSQVYDYVLCGHTHKIRDEKIFNTRVINPGALCFRTNERSFALLDAKLDSLELVYL
ncbi:MAG: YfcE family phosphodiesterase [Bdellovibrionota bacterium]